MKQRIEHIGVVKSVGNGRVCVEITSHSACGSCSARAACGMSESETKIIDVYTPQAADYIAKEQVTVSVGRAMGATAVILAYVVPFVFLLAVLILASFLAISEGIAAISALAAVIIYYGILFLFRHKIENKIHITITKQ
ncbi:MAG: SoxR reducing system RseC family protein [Alistipes sp.]